MIRLIYASSATAEFNESALLKILGQARANNEPLGVTGLLLYSKGSFFQVLEGEPAQVDALYNKIEKDPRHNGIIIIEREEIAERSFPSWSMGFRNLETFDKAHLRGYTDILERRLSAKDFGDKGPEIVGLIEQFRAI